MTSEEIARQRALCAVKGGKCPVVLNENGGPLCAAREALPAALDEIERLEKQLAVVTDRAVHTEILRTTESLETERLRVELSDAQRRLATIRAAASGDGHHIVVLR